MVTVIAIFVVPFGSGVCSNDGSSDSSGGGRSDSSEGGSNDVRRP